jgi:hypothetical protein
MAPINLHGNLFDPAEPASSEPTLSNITAAQESQYIIIQTANLLNEEQKAVFRELACVLDEIVGPNTYLGKCDTATLDDIKKLPFVEHTSFYHPKLKIQSHLQQNLPPANRHEAERAPSAKGPEPEGIAVMISLHKSPGTSPEELVEELGNASLIDKSDAVIVAGRIQTTVHPKNILPIAAFKSVRAIEENFREERHDEVARSIVGSFAYEESDATDPININKEYLGRGQVIHIIDSGFDSGELNNDKIHEGFKDRLKKLYNPNFPPDKTDAVYFNDFNGHGTHVCGCALLDYKTNSMAGIESNNQPGRVRGTAPAAQFICTKDEDTTGKIWDGAFASLMESPYKEGARVSNYSTGRASDLQTAYDDKCKEVDDYLFHKADLVFTQSAGNSGIDQDRKEITGRAACKNVITVGNSRTNRKINDKNQFDRTQLHESDPFTMWKSSSRGPTFEGRIKPDIVAPGMLILSSATSCVKPDESFGSTTDKKLCFSTGTSQAAPVVAGCAAVLREALQRAGVENPSASVIKALLINGAVYMPSVGSPDDLPNGRQGFGRLNLRGSLYSISNNGKGGFENNSQLSSGEPTPSIEVKVPEPVLFGFDQQKIGFKLKVTLTWADRGGAVLVNKLGLTVTASDGQTRHGNKGTEDIRGTNPEDFDGINNVQQVVWKNIRTGTAKISVIFIDTFEGQPVNYALAWSLE